jgi:peptidoglycan hydrolase-like protein with peptidoglycan-binding domain
MVVLRRGAKGENVKRLQSLLRSHGSPSLVVDGDFGPATEAAVRHFQSEHKLAVDGVVGPQTWAALTGGTPTASHEQRIKQAVAFFSKHWSREQAIGIVANLDAESGMDPGIQQHGGGPGYGLAQWEGPRQLEFQRWAHRSIKGSSFDQQLEFVQYELTHTERSAGNKL